MNKIIQEQQELIPQELVEKYDNDKELVQQFIQEGYSITELQNASIVHATKYDPLVILESGETIGFYIEPPNRAKYNNDSRTYNNRFTKRDILQIEDRFP